MLRPDNNLLKYTAYLYYLVKLNSSWLGKQQHCPRRLQDVSTFEHTTSSSRNIVPRQSPKLSGFYIVLPLGIKMDERKRKQMKKSMMNTFLQLLFVHTNPEKHFSYQLLLNLHMFSLVWIYPVLVFMTKTILGLNFPHWTQNICQIDLTHKLLILAFAI